MPVGSIPCPSSVGLPAVTVSTGCCLPGTASTALLQLLTMCDSPGDSGCARGTPAVRDHRDKAPEWDTAAHTGTGSTWCCAGTSSTLAALCWGSAAPRGKSRGMELRFAVLPEHGPAGVVRASGAAGTSWQRRCGAAHCVPSVTLGHTQGILHNGEEGAGIPSEHISVPEHSSLASGAVT